MRASELAIRYAKAAFELAVEQNAVTKVADDLLALDRAITANHDIHSFLINPLVSAESRIAVLEKAFEGQGLSKVAHDLIVLLAKKHRFVIFQEVVRAFGNQADNANNVVRGTVRSASELAPAERERIEKTVEGVLKKKVIMTYKVDPTVIGGLVAQVGSYTFDDSIDSHLKRMNEELKRRTV